MSELNDPEAVRQQYATYDSLRMRQEIHEKYTVPKINYTEWVLHSFQWRGDERVLDIGSGAGTYFQLLKLNWPEVRYCGLDISPGMLQKHPAKGGLLLGNAVKLPFPDDSFDVVMANHMIYHLEDIDGALAEFRRVLKPDGVLMAATNSVQSMPELQVLMRRAILLLTRTSAAHVQPPVPASNLFALENGTRRLARQFYAVVRHDLPSKLVFPDIEPVMQYLESTRSLREAQLPDDVAWDDVMMIMRQQINHLIQHLGEMAVNKLAGVLIASDRGGFIREFVERQAEVESSEAPES
jgi:ubiquinone/menaquinone biosynthesis C-methylase UbiE